MKWKVLFGVICIILTGSMSYAKEETYIVQFNDKVQSFSGFSGEMHTSRNYCTATYEELQEYIDAGIVDYYEPDYAVELSDSFTLADENSSQWNLETIKISKPWNIGCYGNDVVVGVIDSGCFKHPDLANNLLPGQNYTSADKQNTEDNIGHGTFVSGIIAAECNGQYIDGIAPGAKIVPLKCFDSGVITQTSMISDAIYDAVDFYNCDVINLSLEIPQSKITKTLELSIKYALRKGCIVVAAVGNGGTAIEYYPAKYDDVIGVGSVDKDGVVSYFSQHNRTVDVVAPGQGITSVSISGYAGDSGTSFATPHVSAMAAIAKCIDEDITATEFGELLKNTSLYIGNNTAEKYDEYYGYGLVDAEKMIDELLKGKAAFLSPIFINGSKLSAVLYNNSDAEIQTAGITANYENNALTGKSVTDITLPPGGVEKIECDATGSSVKIMIWSETDKLIPLVPYREYIK